MSKYLLFLVAVLITTVLFCTKVDFDDIVAGLDQTEKDTKAPTIFLDVDNPDYVIVNSVGSYSFTATAYDTTIDSTVVNYSADIIYENTVDPTEIGTYKIYLSVSDSAGNTAYDTLTVIVSDSADIPEKDTVPPVVTLIGSASISHPINTYYKDQGAVAIDDVDDTVKVISSGVDNVDTTKEGTYLIKYWAFDSSGNISDTVKRYVFVTKDDIVDSVAPVITIPGQNPMSIDSGTGFNEPNVTANDDVDGDLTSSVQSSGDVDTNTIGTYLIIYTVEDAAGNEAKDTLTVNVTSPGDADTVDPVITIPNPNPMTIDSGTGFNKPNVTASDNKDGDITSDIQSTGTVDTNTVGTYLIIYTVQDAAGNEAKDTLTVNVVSASTADTIAPVIVIPDPNPMTIDSGTGFNKPNVTASDNKDGDITSDIQSTGTVDTNTVGTYLIIYTVQDAAGNEAKDTLTVNVISTSVADTIAPVISIPNPNPDTIWVDEVWNEPTVTATDNVDGTVSVTKVDSTVNPSSAGNYHIIYSATDVAGNEGKDTLKVVVQEDTEAPVITISGANPLEVDSAGTYSTPSATALDNKDGSFTNDQINKTDPVDVNTLGTYNVIYSVSDVAGNEGKDTLVVNVVSASSDPCAGIPDWVANEWPTLVTGDQRVHNNKLWDLTGSNSYAAYEPGSATSDALNVWTFVDDCNP